VVLTAIGNLKVEIKEMLKVSEDNNCLLLCDIARGMQNSVTKEFNLLYRQLGQMMLRIDTLERHDELGAHGKTPLGQGFAGRPPRHCAVSAHRLDTRHGHHPRIKAAAT